ncbi:uncharacterized protein LOC127791831 [Diospyros lotus]|uniref:uncharacterized protein LOC127791831 n=1 Tax=Diospyros lotus TaxID=55363 RepID=UPI0022542667|nr:uncharacterized protein LOC127791831 [Diospyros lotus]
MRRKSASGGRRRPSKRSKLSLRSSTNNSSSVGQDCGVEPNNDGEVLVTSRPYDNLADPCRNGEPVAVTEEACGLEPQDVSGPEDILEKDWTEKEVCIKCNRSGKVLACSDNFCPLVIHEECMRCSARFDSMGKFYCPYCLYKQASLDTRKARQKAMMAKKDLSVFLDKRMLDGEPQSCKAVEVGQTNSNPSAAVRDIEHDNMKIRLNGNEPDKHSVQMEKGQQEERFNSQCTTGTLPSGGAKALGTSVLNDIVPGRSRDHAKPEDGSQRKIAIGKKMHSRPTIGYGDGDSGACYREEGIGCQSELEVGEGAQVGHSGLVGNDQNERIVQDGQAGPLEVSSTVKETAAYGVLHISARGELSNSEIVKEDKIRKPEAEEEMQEQGQGNAVSSCERDSIQHDHGRENDSSRGDDVAVSPQRRSRKRKNINVVQSPIVDRPRRFGNKLSIQPYNNVAPKEKTEVTRKSKEKLKSPPMLLYMKRKRVPWTAEEEEMLKEGVLKFSTTVNKNLPWRKILEFGRHVFERTRTPVDLKDKWRKILAKNPQQSD